MLISPRDVPRCELVGYYQMPMFVTYKGANAPLYSLDDNAGGFDDMPHALRELIGKNQPGEAPPSP